MTTNVPFSRMYGIGVSYRLVHVTHLYFSYSIIGLIFSSTIVYLGIIVHIHQFAIHFLQLDM